MEMADRIAEDGFKDVGYEFVSIDVSQSRARNISSYYNTVYALKGAAGSLLVVCLCVLTSDYTCAA